MNPGDASTDQAVGRKTAAIANPSRPISARVDGLDSRLDSRLDSLRASLDAAIIAQQWGAVEAIHSRMIELERAGVIDLEHERAKRR